MIHLGTISSGAASAYVCKLLIDEVGKENVRLIFTDTLWEDEDNYRFLDEIVEHLGAPFIRLCYGKNPLELAWEHKALPNNRMPFCSRILKRETMESYVKSVKEEDEDVTIWWGIDIEEKRRAEPIEKNWERKFDVKSRFPLIEKLITRSEIFAWLDEIGIKRPRMYDKGYSHANCAGRCVRAGLKHWTRLFQQDPDRYLEVERLEQQWQHDHDKPYTILKKSIKGTVTPISLKDYRLNYIEGGDSLPDEAANVDIGDGACACMSVYAGED